MVDSHGGYYLKGRKDELFFLLNIVFSAKNESEQVSLIKIKEMFDKLSESSEQAMGKKLDISWNFGMLGLWE